MSGVPLPTIGCKCATCEWLRQNGVSELGFMTPAMQSTTVPLTIVPRCAVCGQLVLAMEAHFCPGKVT